MKCSNPVNLTQGQVGCGQCMSCRINRKRLWSGRMLMESQEWPEDSITFATFTYSNETVPVTDDGLLTLRKEDGRLARKRLQYELGKQTRFFWCGEYGDKTDRPHYHAVLFGFPARNLDVLQKVWPAGFVTAADLTAHRALYIAGYVTKKMTREDDARLDGREPEYAQMSRRPALGDGYINRLADWLTTAKGSRWLSQEGDVPNSIRVEGRTWPLGDRHKRMMRAAVGLPELRTELERLDPRLRVAPEIADHAELKRRRIREDQHKKRSHIKKARSL